MAREKAPLNGLFGVAVGTFKMPKRGSETEPRETNGKKGQQSPIEKNGELKRKKQETKNARMEKGGRWPER